MPEASATNPVRRVNRLRWINRRPVRVLGCFLAVWIASIFGGSFREGALIWMAGGVLLAYVLLAPRRSWPLYLTAGVLAHLAALPFMSTPLLIKLLFVPHDPIEVLLAASLLRRRSAQLPEFTRLSYLWHFTLYALIVSPLIVSFAYAAIAGHVSQLPHFGNVGSLFASDSIGLLVVTPACVAVFLGRLRKTPRFRHVWPYMLSVVAVCILIFGQARFPLNFLLLPLLVIVLLRLGLGWACLATLAATAIGAWCTLSRYGPFAAVRQGSAFPPGIHFQLFIVSVIVVLYSVSVVLEELRNTERRLQRTANLHRVVAENSRDVILHIDSDGRHIISAPERFWGGWTRREVGTSTFDELLHPEDRGHLAEVFRELRAGKDGDLVECRVRNKEGGYVWLESSMRCVRDPITRAPSGILATIREITERKRAEEHLREAYRTVEALAVTDPLTDLANRRRFDESLAKEWRRALREKHLLSLVLIDVDSFKAYNDMYGHRSGDDCLKEIAHAVGAGAARPADLAARIGGDEFALLLPSTHEDGAMRIAQKIAEALRARAIVHGGSPTGLVSVSIGCGTLIPQPGQTSTFLFDLADEALYSAKGSGRNKICTRTTPRAAGQTGALQPAPKSAR